jgi:hypothetical protein
MGVLNLEGITYSNDNSVPLKRQVTLALPILALYVYPVWA